MAAALSHKGQLLREKEGILSFYNEKISYIKEKMLD